jgi:hypothetical protein
MGKGPAFKLTAAWLLTLSLAFVARGARADQPLSGEDAVKYLNEQHVSAPKTAGKCLVLPKPEHEELKIDPIYGERRMKTPDEWDDEDRWMSEQSKEYVAYTVPKATGFVSHIAYQYDLVTSVPNAATGELVTRVASQERTFYSKESETRAWEELNRFISETRESGGECAPKGSPGASAADESIPVQHREARKLTAEVAEITEDLEELNQHFVRQDRVKALKHRKATEKKSKPVISGETSGAGPAEINFSGPSGAAIDN